MTHFQQNFVAHSPAVRVAFGPGIRKTLGDEIARLGRDRALILSTPHQANSALEFAALAGSRAAGVFSKATMHTPTDVTAEAIEHVSEIGADCIVSVGGGSTVGLGKAIALRTGLPQISVPTTYAGSEATPILGQTENGVKTTLRDPKVQPGVILYDAELVASLPPKITMTSALNAIAHAAEALYAADRNPIATTMAVEGMTSFRTALPRVAADPSDLQARGETLYGAWLCGSVLGQVGMALHHKLCHTLGGAFDLPHADTHAILLPHTVGYNAEAVPELLAPVAQIFGGPTPGAALHRFAGEIDAPQALSTLGLTNADLDHAADLATQAPYPNPRPLTRDAIRALLQAAWDGTPPQT